MAHDLTFYTNPMSRGRIVRWMLEEIAQPYDTEILEYGTTMKAPEYLAINPMGKVPALRHKGSIITEATAICAYLADAFPDAKLAPPIDSPLRGPYYRWLFFTSGPYEAAAMNEGLGVELSDKQKGMAGYGCYKDVITILDATLSQSDYLVGNAFSAADLVLGANLGFGLQFGHLEKRPSFISYHERVSTRPAAIKAQEIDNALLAQKQA